MLQHPVPSRTTGAARAAGGFTLIEIMVVIVILGILATLVVPKVLGRTDASSRQLLRRARQRLDAGRARTDADLDRRDEITRRFVDACNGGDFDAFFELLTDDAVLTFDGGPEVRTAARHPIRGADRVARFLTYVMDRLTGGDISVTTLNGGPAMLVSTNGDDLIGAVFVDAAPDGRIGDIRWVRNPDKLSDLR